MTQLTLFSNEITDRQVKRERQSFDSHELAVRYATEARGSGKYSDVFLVKVLDKTVVITESEI